MLLLVGLLETLVALVIFSAFCGCTHRIEVVPPPRVVHLHVPVPCTTPLPPPAPLEEHEADPKDGAHHDRIICGALEPWECERIRNAIWSTYGHLAEAYITMIRAECARGVEP